MHRRRRRLASLGVVALALSVAAGLSAGAVGAKKKAKVGGTVDITQPVNAQIPDATANTDGLLASTIAVGGKKFKGTKIRDVNVTVQTTGSSGPPNPSSATQLFAKVTAPNGGTVWLWGNYFTALTGQSIGPLTLDDESPLVLGGTAPPPNNGQLASPYAGTAQPNCVSSHGVCTLSALDNGPVTGTWTLRVFDRVLGAPPATSILNSWRLTVQAGKAFKTK